MFSLRAASRVSRITCVRSSLRQIRHDSNTSNSTSGGLSQSLIGGLAGGGLVFLGGYTYYHFSGKQFLEAPISYQRFLHYNSKRLQEQKPSSTLLERPRMHSRAMQSSSKSLPQNPTKPSNGSVLLQNHTPP